jgi:predicted porin
MQSVLEFILKKLLALSALAAAAVSVHAADAPKVDLTVYGLLDGSYGRSIGDAMADTKADFHSGGDNGSSEGNSTTKIGLKGATELAPGLKANFKLETGGIGSDGKVNGNGTFFNRQAWFGASGSWGEVRFGRQDNVPFQAIAGYDLNGASNGVSAWGYSMVAPFGSALDRQSKSLQYIAPTVSGLTAQVGFVNKANVIGGKNTMSAAVTYAAGPLSATVTHETARTTAVAASYDLGVAKLTGGYTNASNTAKGFVLGASTVAAGVTFGAQYGQNTKGDKDKAIELFANKEVFKNTTVYAELGRAKNDTGVAGNGYAAGFLFTF